MFTVDGIEWTIPCDIERKPDLRDSDISGLMLDRTVFHDVIGTYMNYDITLVPNPSQMGDYYALYEVLTAPVPTHEFALPYNNMTVLLLGHVRDISDVYVRMAGGQVYWKGMKFSVEAIHPTKQETLQQVIVHGLPALPDVAEPSIGDTYTYTGSGWERVQ